VTLRNGVRMPVLAAGTWQYHGDEAKAVVTAALAAGFTHIDTAYLYENQRSVSAGLKAAGKPRAELFITTKVPGCGLPGVRSSSCEGDTLKLIRGDLAQLNSEFHVGILDLVLIHFPPCTEANASSPSPLNATCFAKKNGCTTEEHCHAVQAQWSAMEKAYKANLTRAIGVSNYCAACFDCLASGATEMPMVNQVQYHVGMGPDPQGFRSLAQRKGIALQAWSPLGHGGHGSSDILSGNLTTSIGKRHGKTAAQVALKWILAQNVSVATKSSSPKHLREDLDLFDFELTQEDIASLNGADFAKADTPSFLCTDPAPAAEAGPETPQWAYVF